MTSAALRAAAASAPGSPPSATRRKRSDAEYVPERLRQFVFHSQDDFYVSRFFEPLLLAHLMYEGFLPIASEFQGQCFLLPKLHRQRCVLLLGDTPEHVPKSVKKRAKKFRLVLNRDFDGVVAGCHEKHGIPWLYPPIVAGFRALYEAGDAGVELFPGRKVRFFTVELYDAASDTLAAGELGYSVGSVYTSLTGFSRVDGAGTVQLHALSKLLYLSGIKMWDLGMSMDYKMGLGAHDLARDDFLEQLYAWRPQERLLRLAGAQEGDVRVGVTAKALLELSRPPLSAQSDDVGKSEQPTPEKKQKKADVKKGEQEEAKPKEAGAKRKHSSDEGRGEEKKGRSEVSTAGTEASKPSEGDDV